MVKNTDIKAIMGKNIAKARKKLGYSQEKFAELTAISLSTLSKIESGRNMAKPVTLTKITQKLNMELYELLLEDSISKAQLTNNVYKKLSALIKENSKNDFFNEALYKYALLLKKIN